MSLDKKFTKLLQVNWGTTKLSQWQARVLTASTTIGRLTLECCNAYRVYCTSFTCIWSPQNAPIAIPTQLAPARLHCAPYINTRKMHCRGQNFAPVNARATYNNDRRICISALCFCAQMFVYNKVQVFRLVHEHCCFKLNSDGK